MSAVETHGAPGAGVLGGVADALGDGLAGELADGLADLAGRGERLADGDGRSGGADGLAGPDCAVQRARTEPAGHLGAAVTDTRVIVPDARQA
jgi:hypothetical protein